MGSPSELRMGTKMLTTTYASMAANRTASPPTPTAMRRAAAGAPPPSGTVPAAVADDSAPAGATSGCIDRDRCVVVGHCDRHCRALARSAARNVEHALGHAMGTRVDPDLAGRTRTRPRYERRDGGWVGRDRDAVGVVAVHRVDALGRRVLRGLHELHHAAVRVEDRRRVDDRRRRRQRHLLISAGHALKEERLVHDDERDLDVDTELGDVRGALRVATRLEVALRLR